MEMVLAQLTAFPNVSKELSDLTERDKIALCIAAGCEMDYRLDGNKYVATTLRPVGFAKINGKFIVYESKRGG